MTSRLTLLDSPSLWYRAFHAVPDSVVAPDGSPVGAVRGFLDLVGRVVRDTRPTELVATLDLDWRPAFRVEAVPSYKLHRTAEGGAQEEPPALAPQVEVLLEVLDALGVPAVGVEGMEADDVIGTLADRAAGAVDVVSGDRDMFQLVRDDGPVRVLYAVEKMKPYGPADVAAKYGIPGTAYAEYAVLRGDPSDGLPGVKGVGDKTAAALVSRFGTVEADPRRPGRRGAGRLPGRRTGEAGGGARLPRGGPGGDPGGPRPAAARAGRRAATQPPRPRSAAGAVRPLGAGRARWSASSRRCEIAHAG